MTLLFLPLLMLSGRWPSEVLNRPLRDCSTSLLVGMLMLVCFGVVGFGWFLFWSGLANPHALRWALGIVTIFVVIDVCLVRTLETASARAKALLIAIRVLLMGCNTFIASHEVLIYIFDKQIASQAKDAGSAIVAAHRQALAAKFNTDASESAATVARTALQTLIEKRSAVPLEVTQLRAEKARCDADAVALARSIPSGDAPNHSAIRNALSRKRTECNSLTKRQLAALQAHNDNFKTLIDDAASKLATTRTTADTAARNAQAALVNDQQAVHDGATRGFARHHLLYEAIRNGRVPWAAALLIGAGLSAIECLGFLIKLTKRPDAATAAVIERELEDSNHAELKWRTQAEAAALIKGVVQQQRDEIKKALDRHARDSLMKEFEIRLNTNALERSHDRLDRFISHGGRVTASMFARFARMVGAVRSATSR